MTLAWLLDTNVLSELMRESPAAEVMAWVDQQTESALMTTSITQAEILAGIAVLSAGKRRDALASGADQLFAQDFRGRCLDFGGLAAEQYALIRAQRQRAGRPISTEDAQIAAIALAANLTLVTRNTKDFEGIDGLLVINPWQPH
jgi:predicted nucleic acid-binding protein